MLGRDLPTTEIRGSGQRNDQFHLRIGEYLRVNVRATKYIFITYGLYLFIYFKYWWPMPLFLFIFSSQIGNEASTLYIQYFAWGLLGGVDVKWSGGLLVLICIDVIVVRIKVSSGCVLLPNGDRQCGH